MFLHRLSRCATPAPHRDRTIVCCRLNAFVGGDVALDKWHCYAASTSLLDRSNMSLCANVMCMLQVDSAMGGQSVVGGATTVFRGLPNRA